MTASAPRSATETAIPDWVHDAVFYEIFADRFANGNSAIDPPNLADWHNDAPTRENFFGGDLAGITGKLDYLAELGINALYLTPIFAANTNHRYDTRDYFQIDPKLGDTDDLRALVTQAHARGIRVVLDGVFNHAGDQFGPFQDVVTNGESSRYRDWFFIQDFPIRAEPPSYQTCGGAPYLPKLNTNNPDVRGYLLEVARHWIEVADIDGWRLDVPWKVPDDFWHELHAVVKAIKPDAYVVGEAWWTWGTRLQLFDGLMNYQLRRRLLDFCVSADIDAEDLAIDTTTLHHTAGGKAMLNLLGSHDTPRVSTLAGGDAPRIELAFSALLTFPGTPMLYYGDEIGLEGGPDPDCRRPMPWNRPTAREELRNHVQRLIAIRRNRISLRRGTWEIVEAFNRVLTFRRTYGSEQTLVVLNGDAAVAPRLTIPIGAPVGASYKDALGGMEFGTSGGMVEVPNLAPHAALILAPSGPVDGG